ncbi:uncharacterized protein TM35_000022130 [Trypanosoma theileri]|uniref:Uncharacterized protein n=1 Tax=Trypanosoma theileri TaxID=67003 RepID=A0A1X0P7G3_9TRYP|nr:uncharacterized protein TM35_000022130 [Trypanosoma theileri]ORC92887.1 hypothetical protein TM35_000022130 [Trypanosoma theileri]
METEFQRYTSQTNTDQYNLYKGKHIRSGSLQKDAANNTGSCSDDDNDDSKSNHCGIGAALVTCPLSPIRKIPRLTSPHNSESSIDSAAAAAASNSHSSHSCNDQTAACVTVMVPTMFTTAAGRPICVRESRRIERDSPYWKLLFEFPTCERVVSSFTDIKDDNQSLDDDNSHSNPVKEEEDDDDEEDTVNKEKNGAAIPLLPVWRRQLRRADPFSSLSLLLPTPIVEYNELRSHSCPPRVQSSNNNKSRNEDTTTINSQIKYNGIGEITFPYSSFTRADGSMIYLSPATSRK